MKKVYISILALILAVSCGGGGSQKSKGESLSTLKVAYLEVSGISEATGFQIDFNVSDDLSDISIEKVANISSWTLQKSIKNNTLRVLAYNKELKPINKETSLNLFKIIIPKGASISLKSYKFVDSFGAPINPENISFHEE